MSAASNLNDDNLVPPELSVQQGLPSHFFSLNSTIAVALLVCALLWGALRAFVHLSFEVTFLINAPILTVIVFLNSGVTNTGKRVNGDRMHQV